MKAKIVVTMLWDKRIGDWKKEKGTAVVSTVSKAGADWSELSPFLLGPCKLYKRNGRMLVSKNMENAWQYAKVYKWMVEEERTPCGCGRCMMRRKVPNDKYWEWAKEGWSNPKAVRYPMGKGAKPEFSWWKDEKLDYVEARKAIYGPLYAEAVQKTEAFARLKRMTKTLKKIVLLDYDARDTNITRETLTDVLNREDKKMGHAFVLAMLLTNDKALKQMELR